MDSAPPAVLVRRWLPAGTGERPHSHRGLELCCVVTGRAALTVGGQVHTLTVLTATLVAPGAVHALAAGQTGACAADLLRFDPHVLGAGDGRSALTAVLRAVTDGCATVSLAGGAGQAAGHLVAEIGTLARHPESCRQALALLCRRMAHLLGERHGLVAAGEGTVLAPRPVPEPAGQRLLAPVFCYIERNLSRPISRDELAREASFAPSYLSAVFRTATGCTIPQYINARRVRMAQELLRGKPLAIAAVAGQVGFRDVSHFNRVFKRLVGATPREYRRG